MLIYFFGKSLTFKEEYNQKNEECSADQLQKFILISAVKHLLFLYQVDDHYLGLMQNLGLMQDLGLMLN